jgi:hypothetical protein
MRPRDLFGVAVRVLGLWEIINGVYTCFYGALKFNIGIGNANVTPSEHYAFATFYAVLGVLLITFADPIVWLVYGLPPKSIPSDDTANSPDTAPSGSQTRE